MLIGMVAFLVAVVRTPLTAIVLITEITGHFEVFYPSIVVGGLTYYFTELLQIKPYNVLLYDRMFRSHNPESSEEAGARYHLFVEIMDGSYFDGKEVDTLALPNHCTVSYTHLFSPVNGKLLGAQIVGYNGVDKRIDEFSQVIKHNGTVYDLMALEDVYKRQVCTMAALRLPGQSTIFRTPCALRSATN